MPQQGHTELVGDSNGRVTAVGRDRHPGVCFREEQQEVAEVSPMGAHGSAATSGPTALGPDGTRAPSWVSTATSLGGRPGAVLDVDGVQQVGELSAEREISLPGGSPPAASSARRLKRSDLPLAGQRMVLTTAGSLDELTSDEPHRCEQQGGLDVVARAIVNDPYGNVRKKSNVIAVATPAATPTERPPTTASASTTSTNASAKLALLT